MERRLGLLLAITLGIAVELGAIALTEPGRLKVVEARAAEAAQGGQGAKLFADNCAGCHGKYGEGQGQAGGPPPLSSREFLSTFDDATIRAVTAKGKASRGMPAWSKQSGGQLAESEIDEIVAFIRAWQVNPPQIPPKAAAASAPASGAAGSAPAGAASAATATTAPTRQPTPAPTAPPTVAATAVQTKPTAVAPAATSAAVTAPPPTAVPAQPTAPPAPKTEPAAAAGPSFAKDLLPTLEKSCGACHQAGAGGFKTTSYSDVMGTGAHKPVVVPGNADGSLLIQKLKGTQTAGGPMPMGAPLAPDVIQKFADWIQAGAKDN